MQHCCCEHFIGAISTSQGDSSEDELMEELWKQVVVDAPRMRGDGTVGKKQVEEQTGLLLADEVLGEQGLAHELQPPVAEAHNDEAEVESGQVELWS